VDHQKKRKKKKKILFEEDNGKGELHQLLLNLFPNYPSDLLLLIVDYTLPSWKQIHLEVIELIHGMNARKIDISAAYHLLHSFPCFSEMTKKSIKIKTLPPTTEIEKDLQTKEETKFYETPTLFDTLLLMYGYCLWLLSNRKSQSKDGQNAFAIWKESKDPKALFYLGAWFHDRAEVASAKVYCQASRTFLLRKSILDGWDHFLLGCLHSLTSCSVQLNLEKAIYHYQCGLEQGVAGAQFNRGCLYQDGVGCERDLNQAIQLFQSAAKQGYSSAFYALGHYYYHGNYVEQSEKKAVEYYQMGFATNHLESIEALAHCYQHGIGVTKEEEQAKKYWKMAAHIRGVS